MAPRLFGGGFVTVHNCILSILFQVFTEHSKTLVLKMRRLSECEITLTLCEFCASAVMVGYLSVVILTLQKNREGNIVESEYWH